MIQLICRFTDAGRDFAAHARPAVALLAAQPSCAAVRLARSTEDPRLWVLTAEFADFADYRTALRPFDVRTIVIPFLSEADQSTSAVLEVVFSATAGSLAEHPTAVDPEQIW